MKRKIFVMALLVVGIANSLYSFISKSTSTTEEYQEWVADNDNNLGRSLVSEATREHVQGYAGAEENGDETNYTARRYSEDGLIESLDDVNARNHFIALLERYQEQTENEDQEEVDAFFGGGAGDDSDTGTDDTSSISFENSFENENDLDDNQD